MIRSSGNGGIKYPGDYVAGIIRYLRDELSMTNSIVNGVEDLHDLFTAVLLGVISTCRNYHVY